VARARRRPVPRPGGGAGHELRKATSELPANAEVAHLNPPRPEPARGVGRPRAWETRGRPGAADYAAT